MMAFLCSLPVLDFCEIGGPASSFLASIPYFLLVKIHSLAGLAL